MEIGQEPREGVPGEGFEDDTEELSPGPSVFRREALGDDGRGPEQEGEPAHGGGGDSIPHALAGVGLSKAFLTDLTLKIMHYSGTPSSAQLMRRLGLGQNMVQQILAAIQEERLCEGMSQSDLFTGNYRYRLSERGTARASEALERT